MSADRPVRYVTAADPCQLSLENRGKRERRTLHDAEHTRRDAPHFVSSNSRASGGEATYSHESSLWNVNQYTMNLGRGRWRL